MRWRFKGWNGNQLGSARVVTIILTEEVIVDPRSTGRRIIFEMEFLVFVILVLSRLLFSDHYSLPDKVVKNIQLVVLSEAKEHYDSIADA